MLLGYRPVFLATGGVRYARNAIGASWLGMLQRLQLALAECNAVDQFKPVQAVVSHSKRMISGYFPYSLTWINAGTTVDNGALSKGS